MTVPKPRPRNARGEGDRLRDDVVDARVLGAADAGDAGDDVGGELAVVGAADEGPAAAERGHQRVGHRADVAPVGAVESRAVFEEILPGACSLQPAQCGERFIDSLARRSGARFEAALRPGCKAAV